MQQRPIPIFGLGGDALTAPENSSTAYWAALGGGAAGFVTGVRLSKDGVIICSNHDDFEATCGDERKVLDLDWRDIRKLDVGFTFRSTPLDSNNQPVGTHGKDKPWLGNLPKKRAIRIPLLSDMLILFARRCSIILLLPDHDTDVLDATLAELQKLGVVNRVLLAGSRETCEALISKDRSCRCIVLGNANEPAKDQLDKAESLGAEGLHLDWDKACLSGTTGLLFDPELDEALQNSSAQLYLGSDIMPFSATPAHYAAILGVDGIAGIIARGVLPSVESVSPPALIATDNFNGTRIDRNLWSAGYSHANQDTEIFQDDGLHIAIKDGGSYSGAAAVCVIPVHGRFDTRVAFRVDNPQQATTFELAAICIDPGYFHTDNSDLDSRNVNLTFDVHGAPPYASSERDENDGFRCGWNNGFNLTRFREQWAADSVNMYNKYGRDVGNGDADNPEGQLRLVRNGQVFACYYTDMYNEAWVCSGAMLVQNISEDTFLRLAAKHWSKNGTPPSNHIQFSNFQLYQF